MNQMRTSLSQLTNLLSVIPHHLSTELVAPQRNFRSPKLNGVARVCQVGVVVTWFAAVLFHRNSADSSPAQPTAR